MEVNQQRSVFRRSESFEINDVEFAEIRIDSNRIIAKGRSWTTFELLISFIGAAWMEKWRRFGTKMLGAGILFVAFPFIMMTIPGFQMLFYYSTGWFFILPPMMLGILLVILWALVKREALKIYTPAETFKIEGSGGFIEAVWNQITSQQRLRDV
ncbi:hypothetical protein EU545_02275 [Candidatus Thorarchaeota archaeon]|nr:MAG: hypothetical protein EU545_02275 [Candidatus Thorarchaeota archaeon]